MPLFHFASGAGVVGLRDGFTQIAGQASSPHGGRQQGTARGYRWKLEVRELGFMKETSCALDCFAYLSILEDSDAVLCKPLLPC